MTQPYIPDDLKDFSKQDPTDRNYFKVTFPDLDINTLYPFQFRWQYADTQEYGKWSATIEESTLNFTVPEVTNIVTGWAGTTLNITFNRPETLIDGVLTNRAKKFEIYLTANDKEYMFSKNVDAAKTSQLFVLTEEVAKSIWRNGSTQQLPTSYSGVIKTITFDDFVSDGVPFSTSQFNDPITNLAIDPNSWSLISVLDGYIVNWAAFTDATAAELYDKTEVFQLIQNGNVNDINDYQLKSSGLSPLAVVYYGDLGTKYVKIRHKTKKGTYSNYSDTKSITSANPSGFDNVAPTNNITLGTPTTTTDPGGIFQFGYQTVFTWTLPPDINTNSIYNDQRGYRIRFRIKDSGNPYTYMSVLGKTATSTKLNGLLAGATYEVGITTYDVYDNVDNENWKTYPDIQIQTSASLLANAKLNAGPMEFGFGVGSGAGNKGIYLAPENYWYITGNTQTSNAAQFKVGGTSDYMFWDGTKLAITGSFESTNARIKGSLDIGDPTASPAIDGQLRVKQTNGGIEIGKLSSAVVSFLAGKYIPGVANGIFAYNNTSDKYVLINAADASIRANNVFLDGKIIANDDSRIGKWDIYLDSITNSSLYTDWRGIEVTLTTTLESNAKITLSSTSAPNAILNDISSIDNLLKVNHANANTIVGPGQLEIGSTQTLFDVRSTKLVTWISAGDNKINIKWSGGETDFAPESISPAKIKWWNYAQGDGARIANLGPNRDSFPEFYRALVVDTEGTQYLGPIFYFSTTQSNTPSPSVGQNGDLYFSTQ